MYEVLVGSTKAMKGNTRYRDLAPESRKVSFQLFARHVERKVSKRFLVGN